MPFDLDVLASVYQFLVDCAQEGDTSTEHSSAVREALPVRDSVWPGLAVELLRTDEKLPLLRNESAYEAVSQLYQQESLSLGRALLERPFVCTFAQTLEYTISHDGRFPESMYQPTLGEGLTDLTMPGLERLQQPLSALGTHLRRLKGNKPAQRNLLYGFLSHMDPADVRFFLGSRYTPGSTMRLLPPSRSECLAAFTALHLKKSSSADPDNETFVSPEAKRDRVAKHRLTVGARALSKHWHRDRETRFWGVLTGTEDAKNEAANAALLRVLTTATWYNLHELPASVCFYGSPAAAYAMCFQHNVVAYEIRNDEGYGARWEAHVTILETVYTHPSSPWTFRGFVEPPRLDGHETGWIH